MLCGAMQACQSGRAGAAEPYGPAGLTFRVADGLIRRDRAGAEPDGKTRKKTTSYVEACGR